MRQLPWLITLRSHGWIPRTRPQWETSLPGEAAAVATLSIGSTWLISHRPVIIYWTRPCPPKFLTPSSWVLVLLRPIRVRAVSGRATCTSTTSLATSSWTQIRQLAPRWCTRARGRNNPSRLARTPSEWCTRPWKRKNRAQIYEYSSQIKSMSLF